MCRTMTRGRKSRGEDTTDVLARRASNTLYPQQVTTIGKTASRHSPVPWHSRTIPTLANLTWSRPIRHQDQTLQLKNTGNTHPPQHREKSMTYKTFPGMQCRARTTQPGEHTSTNKHRYRRNMSNHKLAAHRDKQHSATKSSGETNALKDNTSGHQAERDKAYCRQKKVPPQQSQPTKHHQSPRDDLHQKKDT